MDIDQHSLNLQTGQWEMKLRFRARTRAAMWDWIPDLMRQLLIGSYPGVSDAVNGELAGHVDHRATLVAIRERLSQLRRPDGTWVPDDRVLDEVLDLTVEDSVSYVG